MKRLLLALGILFVGSSLLATHIAGGVIEVTCVSGNTFTVVVRKYRDVSGINFGPNLPITIREVATGNTTTVQLNRTTINQGLQPPTTNPCLVPPPNSTVDEHVYQNTVTLNNGTAYQIYTQDNARNNILNLVNSTGVGQTLYAEFPDPGVYGCNSGPIFDVGPPVSVCINEPLNYDNSATDPDGDQLQYRLCEAFDDVPLGGPPPFTSVPYAAPYTALDPVSANPNFSIDPVTGILTGTPDLAGNWTFTVCVDEFRGGVKIGEYRREVQMTVTTCNQSVTAQIDPQDPTSTYVPNVPVAGGTAGGSTGLPVIASCDDSTVAFTTPNASAFSYSWNFGVPGINSDTSDIQNPTYTYPDTGTFYAQLIINKGFICADTAIVPVIVYPFTDAGFSTAEPQCVGQPVQFTDTSSFTYGSVANWSWSFGSVGVPNSGQQNPARTYPSAGTYNVNMIVESTKGCRDTATNQVTVYNPPAVNAGPPTVTVCAGESVTLPAQASGATSYQWTSPNGTAALDCDTCLNPSASPSTTTVYSLTATGPGGCENGDFITVIVQPSPVVNAGPDQFLCGTGSVQLNAQLVTSPGGVFWNWTPATGLNSNQIPNPTASPTQTTTYIVTATSINGSCQGVDTVTVFLNAVSVDAGTAPTICPGDTTSLSASTPVANATYSWAPATNISDPTAANPDVWPATTTMYTLTITDPVSGCNGVDSVLVTVNPLPPVDAGNDTTICINTTAQLNAAGASTYTWDTDPTLSSTNIPNPVASPTQTTTYYVTGEDAIGCTNRDSITLTVVPPANISVTPDTTICANTSAPLSASGGVNYNWTPTGTLSGATTANPTATPSTTTVYSLTVEDGNGCFVDTTVTVTVTPPPNIDAGTANSICFGDSITLSATGGSSYTWTPNTNIIGTNTANPTVYPPVTTTYTVVGEDATGCSNVDSVTVVVNTLANGGFSPDTAICDGESVVLSANGFTQYTWKPAGSLSNPTGNSTTASPTTTTTYTVVVEDNNGCVDSGTVQVTVNSLPTIQVSGLQTICVGDSAQLTANVTSTPGGQSYVWTPVASLNDPNAQNPWASPTANTIYTVEATDGNGCVNTSTTTVNVNPLPPITLPFASTTICEGDSVQMPISTSASGATYNWAPNNNLTCLTCPDPIAHPMLNEVYTVTVTDAIGCSNRDSIAVNVNVLQPGNFISDTAICVGESVTLFASGFSTYTWFPGTDLSCTNCPTPVATPSTTTTYFAAVEDANGCQDTGSVIVTVNALPTVNAGQDVTICENDDVTLSATAPTATSYSWSPTAGLNNATIASPVASPATTTDYTVTVTDANNCTNNDDVRVTVNQRPPTNAGQDQPICFGDTITLQASGAVSYVWSPAVGLSDPTVANPEAYPATTTTYTVTGTAANGCTQTDEITITVNPLPTISLTPNSSICEGEDIQLVASGGTGYTWSPAASLSCTNCPAPVATPAQTTVYTVEVSTAAGCSDTASVEVFVATPASIGIPNDTAVCPGESVTLNIIGGVTYDWEPKVDITNANTANPTITPTQPRTYTVNIVDNNGCDIQGTVDVGIYTPADPLAGTAQTICVGDSVTLSAQNGLTYNWTPATSIIDPTVSNPTAVPAQTTTFTVEIVDANNCVNTDEVTINVQPLPAVDAGPDMAIYEDSRAVLQASGAQTYLWSPNVWIEDTASASTIIFPEDSIMYYVLGTDAFGCQNTDSVYVRVLPKPKFYVPNAFSPDGDGQNDLFIISYYQNFNLNSFKIFNRWGQLVFETDDVDQGWDGRTPGGEPLPMGTYIFRIEGEDDLGIPQERQGNVTLLR